MGIILIIVIWFLAPIVELGVIIWLAVANDRKKRRIKELTEGLEKSQAVESGAVKQVITEKIVEAASGSTSGHSVKSEQSWVSADVAKHQPILSAHIQRKESRPRKSFAKIDPVSAAFQGTAALIIGVVLVVLSGAVFATTTWAVLPDICKAAGVLLFAGLFFGASLLAERKLKLRRTGWAFYTLGCVFLFLTVLAVGYFEILGPGFVLSGIARWRVLFAGSLMTEAAWCCGYKRFRDRAYTLSCLWGSTVCITFLLLASGLSYSEFVSGLMIYAGVLVFSSEMLESRLSQGAGGMDEGKPDTEVRWRAVSLMRSFAMGHFWCIGILMILNGIYGNAALSMAFALAVQLLVTDRLTSGGDAAGYSAAGYRAEENGAGRNKLLRWMIPVIMFLLFANIRGWFNLTFDRQWDWDVLMFIYLAVLSVWDLVKRDRFWLLLSIVGVLSQALYLGRDMRPLPMLFAVAGYLYLKGSQVKPEERDLYLKDGCLMLLLGLYLCGDYYAESHLQAILPSLAVFTVGYVYAFWKKGGFKVPVQERGVFWDVLAAVIPSYALMLFYGQIFYADCSWYLLPIGAACGICYGILYMGKRSWPHFILALSAMPLPFVMWNYRVIPEHWLFGGFAAVTLAVGLIARRYGAVIRRRESSSGWSVDWYHLLIGADLLLLALGAYCWADTRIWSSVYLILLALYTLQFAAIEKFKKCSFTAALAILVWAWWAQQLVSWPEWSGLAMGLLPVAGAAALLPFIWGDSRGIMWLRRAVHTICLFLLTMDGLWAEDVRRALLLEAVCLAVFLGSHAKRSVWWMRISGGVTVAVALYMTRAFWLSISWWVYLLAAGLGLILFAAFSEKRRQEKNQEKDFDR